MTSRPCEPRSGAIRRDRRDHPRADPANAGLISRSPVSRGPRAECSAHGALLIFDEVMTGFRVARGGAQEVYGIRPDLTALGKVIGGGLPVGAFGGRAEIMDQLSPLGPVYQAGTLSGNPLAMAAGLAQLRELERIDGWKQLEKLGAQFEQARRCVRQDQGRGELSSHRLDVLPLFHRRARAQSRRRAPERHRQVRSLFQSMPRRGRLFAPSQFETGFLSTAQTGADREDGANRARGACAGLRVTPESRKTFATIAPCTRKAPRESNFAGPRPVREVFLRGRAQVFPQGHHVWPVQPGRERGLCRHARARGGPGANARTGREHAARLSRAAALVSRALREAGLRVLISIPWAEHVQFLKRSKIRAQIVRVRARAVATQGTSRDLRLPRRQRDSDHHGPLAGRAARHGICRDN